MAEPTTYPVRLEGRLDPGLSRWLWLVKWLLAIPHYIVLFFLWIAFFVLTVVAFFAILFTARYPKGLFEFNVGVLRWTWRVAFYSYGALGTDRYPPFTLDSAPDYPATLEVDYPEKLSRGLVLVKWWLLAIPHYLLVGVFVGGGWWGSRAWDDDGDAWRWGGSSGLIGLLVLFAAIALLFLARYPRGIFDFVLGLDRWVARVAGYAGLMTDAYPPFRLDQGGEEPAPEGAASALSSAPTGGVAASPLPPAPAGEGAAGPLPPSPAGEAAGTAPRSGRGVGGVVLLILGSIAALVALALLAAGTAAVVVDQTQRDDDGFVMSPTESFSTSAYAIASESVDVSIDGPDWAAEDILGTIRIRSESDRPVFVGIGRESDVDRYLNGVVHAVVTDIGREPEYEDRPGGRLRAPPRSQTFWVASASGAGEQTLEWDPEDGSWNVVVANTDGSRGVEADLSIGAELDALLWVGIGLLVVGGLLALGAAAAITAGIRRGR